MNYLPEKTEELSTLEINSNLILFDLSNNKELLKIDNILPGKYKIFKNVVQDYIEDDVHSIFAHAFVLHESIAAKDLSTHNWNHKDKLYFDFFMDEAYMGLFTSPIGLKQFEEKNPTFEDAVNNPEMVQTFDSGLAFSFPYADDGFPIELIKVEEKIIGFRIQSIGKEFCLEDIKNHKSKPKI